MLNGNNIAGSNPNISRADNDFYATNPKAVETLFKSYDISNIKGNKILEPCVGMGHILKGLQKSFGDRIFEIDALDIVDRGYPNTRVVDFLDWNTENKYDLIISNPPYSLAEDFCRKGLSLLENNGQMMMFLKIQFLEGLKRKDFFEKFPPKYIYVFRNRMSTWRNGEELTPEGKKWVTVMCHAWFIWEKDCKSEPIIRWLETK